MTQSSNLYVSSHPLIRHKLSEMRDVSCTKAAFRQNLNDIAALLTYEATAHFEEIEKTVTTPLCDTQAPTLKNPNIAIVPILRAGLGLSVGMETLLPEARICHIGLYRDEETKEPVEYLVKLPDLSDVQVLAVDPMLATGNSAKYSIELLLKHGASIENITMVALLSAPEGVQCLHEAFPDLRIVTAALDSHLNENAFIVPGLGDAGDRLFGTENL